MSKRPPRRPSGASRTGASRARPPRSGASRSGGSRARASRPDGPRREPRSEPRSGPKSEPRSEPRPKPRPEPRSEPRPEPRPAPATPDFDPSDWIFGRHAVLEALRAGRPIHKLWVGEGTHGTRDILQEARAQGVGVQRVPRSYLDRLSHGLRHQGVIAAVAAIAFVPLEEILSARPTGPGAWPFLVVLDGVLDPQNLGAILRTAVAVGCDGAVIGRHRAAGLTPAVVRASAGAVEHIPVARVAGIPAAIRTLQQSGICVVGLDPSAESDFREMECRQPLAIVIGSEGRGLGRLAAERCDQRVRLPMNDRIGSFNASVAAALCLYQVYSSRHPL